MRLRILADVDLDKWSRLLQNAERASVFHTREWAKVITSAYPRRAARYIVVEDEANELAGGMPLIDRLEWGAHVLSSMPLGTYGGPLLRTGIDEEVEHEILDRFSSLKYFPVTPARRLVSFNRKLDHLLPQKFRERISYSNVLFLDLPLDQIWDNKLHSKIRNQIRQSQQKGVTTEISSDSSHLKEFYRMAVETSERHESRPLPYDLYRSVFDNMGEPGLAKLCLARHDNIYVAASICFTFKDSVFYWMNVSHREFWGLRPNNLIIWSMIEWAHGNGFRYFNFGATPPRADELKRFKSRWGSEEVPCYEYEKRTFPLNLIT
jgi:hypothetical protein